MAKPMQGYPNHLAWHETMELHELVALQTAQLVAFKKKLPSLQDPGLRTLYTETIQSLEHNIRELLYFYPLAPMVDQQRDIPELPGIESAHLLGCLKTNVRTYAIAITEAATPRLRDTFHKHLDQAIALHGRVFYFMYQRGYYPAYNLNLLLENDVKNARLALSL
jgi:spore coat protein F